MPFFRKPFTFGYNIGSYYQKLGESPKALDYYKQSLQLFSTIRQSETGVLSSIISIYDSLGDKKNALDFLNQSLKMFRKNGNHLLEAYAFYCIASVMRQLGNLEESLTQIEVGLNLIDTLSYNESDPPEFFENLEHCYEFYISLLNELHKQHPAAGYDVKARQAIIRMNKVLLNE